ADTVSGMLSGLKVTPYADNAQFYGLAGGKAHYETLFDTAFVIWRKKGLVTRPVEAKDWADTRFLQALAASYPGAKVEEPKMAKKEPGKNDRAIINKQLEIHFTPGSALRLAFIMPVLVLGAWCVVSYGHLAPPDFVPSPTEVVRGTLQLFLQYDLATAILVSTKRIVLSFLLAAAVALPLGILMGAFAPVHHVFESIMAPLRYMPISAFIPLLILWFGIYDQEKIAFLFLGVFVYLLPVVVSAIRGVPEELVQTALTLGASKMQVIRTVLMPAALPDIFDSFRVMNAILWTYVILAEAVNPERGLGYMVQLAYAHQKASWSFAGLIVIGGIGLLTDFIIRAASAMLFRWREEEL